MEERKQWRIDHPPGFFAKFAKNKDDSQNMMIWETGIPGREGMCLDRVLCFTEELHACLEQDHPAHVLVLMFLNLDFSDRNRLGRSCVQSHNLFQQGLSCKGFLFFCVVLWPWL